jgi:crossover junction endodeoxyribonuclease RuvC
MTVYLGIDPGLEDTGWNLLHSVRSTRVILGSGQVSTKVCLPDSKRIELICAGLQEVVAQARAGGIEPEVAAVEQYVYQGLRSQTKNAFRISRLVGAIEGAMRALGMHVVGYTINQSLASMGCASNASKAVAKMAVARLGKVDRAGTHFPSNEHQRMAFAQGWCASQRRAGKVVER